MKLKFLIVLLVVTTTCNSQQQKEASQIGQYVVNTFQDSKGNLWFGTLEKGIAKYDGKELTYLTTKDGLPSNRIVNIVEDNSKNLWLGTGAGLTKYDGKTFTNYSEKDGLCSNMISCLYIDSRGTFWIGTWNGVCTFDGTQFEKFLIPYPKVTTKINPDTKDWITEITEDAEGNIWFGRDNYGASKFNGDSFTHFTKKEGLNSNNVQSIVEDTEGTIWIATRVAEKDNPDPDKRIGNGGLNKFDGKKFIHFPNIAGLHKSDVFTIYKDNTNKLWMSTTSNGVYTYVDNEFINYAVPKSTMSFLRDTKGTIWLGCAGGLYNIDSTGKVQNITTNGPWQ